MIEMAWLTIIALGSAFSIILAAFLRIAFLRAKQRLQAANFSITLAAGLSIAALDLYYVNLAS